MHRNRIEWAHTSSHEKTWHVADQLYHYFLGKSKIVEYQKAGRAIIGTLCNSVPEEIIHSLGAVPIRMLGSSNTTENANLKLPSWLCAYARRILEDGLNGSFNYLEGVVGSTSDDTKMRLYSAYKFYVKPKFSYIIQMPYVKSEASQGFFSKELERFAHRLSSFLAKDFSEDELRKSVTVYNEFRRLCGELQSLRADDTPKIRGVEWMKLMLGSVSMLKEDFNENLKNDLALLKCSEGLKDYKLRVHVSGTDFYDLELFDLIESMGAIIVSDDLCASTAYFSDFANEAVEPFKALAERYLSFSACTLTTTLNNSFTEEKIRFIKKAVGKSKADGLIIIRDRGCEISSWQCPSIVQELNEFPMLIVDVDAPLLVDQYKTRIEAFIESYG